jgi:hypothetical protein
MPRALSLRSREFIAQRRKSHPRSESAQLGTLLAGKNIPASAVAAHLEVSTDTIYRWMYGDVPERARGRLRGYMTCVRQRITRSLEGSLAERTEQFNALLDWWN